MDFVAQAAGHIFGGLALILLLIWLIHFRGGIDLDSYDASQIFNVHPFLMYFGFVFFAGEAIMAYKRIEAQRKSRKFVHMCLHVVAITLGIVGIYAVFKYHNKQGIPHMYSLHSWLGMATFCLYGLQWLFGFFNFWIQVTDLPTRSAYAGWHIFFGRVLLYMAICTAESGLMQSSTILGLQVSPESRLVNFTGLAILLFGIAVDLKIASAFVTNVY